MCAGVSLPDVGISVTSSVPPCLTSIVGHISCLVVASVAENLAPAVDRVHTSMSRLSPSAMSTTSELCPLKKPNKRKG
jgi:hypothetical protein